MTYSLRKKNAINLFPFLGVWGGVLASNVSTSCILIGTYLFFEKIITLLCWTDKLQNIVSTWEIQFGNNNFLRYNCN